MLQVEAGGGGGIRNRRSNEQLAVGQTLIIAVAKQAMGMTHEEAFDDPFKGFLTAFSMEFVRTRKAEHVAVMTHPPSPYEYDVFFILKPSKKDIRWWKDCHMRLTKSVGMLVPMEGHSKVTDNNCGLTSDQLTEIFFGPCEPEHIAAQVLALRQNIIFPKPVDASSGQSVSVAKAVVATGKAGKRGHKQEQERKGSQNVGEQEASERPFIVDLPLGMRLLNSYRSIQKDKKIRVWMPSDSAGASTASGEPVPGSAEWKALKAKQQAATAASSEDNGGGGSVEASGTSAVALALKRATAVGGSAVGGEGGRGGGKQGRGRVGASQHETRDRDNDTIVSLALKTPLPNWLNLSTLGRPEGSVGGTPQAMFPRQSHLSSSMHCGEEDLYALAYNVRAMGTTDQLVGGYVLCGR